MPKTVWITAIAKEKNRLTGLLKLSKKYGLSPDGHFWVDDLAKMAWQAPLEPLCAKETALWVILAGRKDLELEPIRYGLSLLALRLQNQRGIGFPILFATYDSPLAPEDLPTPFRGAVISDADNPSLGAKMAARANIPVKKIDPGYRLDIHAGQGFGTWIELGPAGGNIWNGVLAGGLTATVNAHGVGPSGVLPLKTILEYPMRGIKLTLGEDEYDAWAVKNTIDHNQSYYVRFTGIPGSILFGQLPDEETQADFHVLKLV